MMSPEMLARLQGYVERLSDDGLLQLSEITRNEIAERVKLMERPPEIPPEGGLKDGGPTREP